MDLHYFSFLILKVFDCFPVSCVQKTAHPQISHQVSPSCMQVLNQCGPGLHLNKRRKGRNIGAVPVQKDRQRFRALLLDS